MALETRNIETNYFNADGSLVGRTDAVLGDFDAYGASFTTTSRTWWTERGGIRTTISVSEIETLIAKHKPQEPVLLANFFADTRGYGQVVSGGFTLFVDSGNPLTATKKRSFQVFILMFCIS